MKSIFQLNVSSWSCGESNPGPNKQPKCFLHVYLHFSFRVWNDLKLS